MTGTQTSATEERVLVIDGNDDAREAILQSLAESVPTAVIEAARTIEDFRRLGSERAYDVVVVDDAGPAVPWKEFLHELRLRDYEPSVLVVAEPDDPLMVAEIFNSGCDRLIHRGGAWVDELGPAVRHALRLRRLEEQNRKLVAKLTEANILLEEKNRRLDEFSAAVAHDLRGPLGGVVMKLDYLSEVLDGALDAKWLDMIRRALRTTERLTGILQGMYSYAKLGAQSAKMAEISLDEVVQGVVEALSFDDALSIRLEIGDLPNVWGSATLLHRVFQNLITNAVKYNDKKEIVVQISCVGMSESGLGKFCTIEVSDNGPGIPEEDQERIFSMFFRGRNIAPNGEGLGLGLSFVQRIIELHFGKIELRSTSGKGTTFSFTLPVERIDFVQG